MRAIDASRSAPGRGVLRAAQYATLALFLVCACMAHAAGVSGTWQLDAGASDDFDDAADALNDRLNEEKRENKKQQFMDTSSQRTRSRFQAQADASEKMIREDLRSLDWQTDLDVVAIANARTLRIHHGSKVVMLYDKDFRRLLTINPAGRSFSYRGTEVTQDDVGTTLTYEEDGVLVIETDLYDGGRLVERYVTEDSRLRQSLNYRQQSTGPVLKLERVFDAAP